MRTWSVSVVLILAVASGAVGVGAHDSESACPMAAMDCCKKAQSNSRTPEASMARLCCNLNCSEHGTSGVNNASSVSSQHGSAPIAAIIPGAMPLLRIQFSHIYPFGNRPHNPNPKYIQHLALLI